jgi:hypothetical protein
MAAVAAVEVVGSTSKPTQMDRSLYGGSTNREAREVRASGILLDHLAAVEWLLSMVLRFPNQPRS